MGWWRIWSPDSPYTKGTPATGGKYYEAWLSGDSATDLVMMLRLITGDRWYCNEMEDMRDSDYIHRSGYDEHTGKDGKWMAAENWGGDPEGKLAKALERAREKAKQPRKPLKIERLKAESHQDLLREMEQLLDDDAFVEHSFPLMIQTYEKGLSTDEKAERIYNLLAWHGNEDIYMDWVRANVISTWKKAESFGAENKGMTDVWWAYKIDDEDWKDYTRYKRRNKDSDLNEIEMFMEWRHEKSWEDDEDIRYYLRFFDNPKSAQKFIGRTKVIYSDSGDENDDELIRVYGRLDSEGIDYALSLGDNIDWELYPLLFSGNILSDLKQRAAESFGAESPQVDDEGMLGRIRKVRIVGIEDNNGKKDRKGNPIQNVYFYRDLLDSGEADWRIHTDSEREFLSRFKPDKRAETFNASTHNPYSVDLYEDEDTPPYYPYLAPEYTTVRGRGRYRFNRYNRDGMTHQQYRFTTKDAAIEWLCWTGHTVVQVKPNQPQYDFPPNTPDSEIKKWHRAESYGAETRSLAKRSWDTLNNIETAVGTVGLAHMIGFGAIFGGSLAFLKGRKSNSKTEK